MKKLIVILFLMLNQLPLIAISNSRDGVGIAIKDKINELKDLRDKIQQDKKNIDHFSKKEIENIFSSVKERALKKTLNNEKKDQAIMTPARKKELEKTLALSIQRAKKELATRAKKNRKKINNNNIENQSDLNKNEEEKFGSLTHYLDYLKDNKIAKHKNANYNYLTDFYKVPSWPFYMLYTQNNNPNLFRIDFKYDYATNSYDSNGSSRDVTALVFGEESIEWQDLLMTLRLDKSGILRSYQALNPQNDDERANAKIPSRVVWNLFKNELADKPLIFLGNMDQLELSVNYLRYLNKNISLGFQVPFGYKVHHLKVDSTISSLEFITKAIQLPENSAQIAAAYGTSIGILDRNMIAEVLNYILEPKGLSYNSKISVIGIGDVAAFLNFYLDTKYLQRCVIGSRISWPTANEAAAHKVWAPQLGNGFTKLSVYSSMLFNNKNKYLNPHIFLQASWNWPGHKKTRVPRIVNFDGQTAGNPAVIDNINYYRYVDDDGARKIVCSYLNDYVVFAGNIQYTQAVAYTEYDTQIPALADNAVDVRVQPGPEFEVQLGNMFDGFIFRGAFLDLYYNFRAKWKDYIGGNLKRDIWAVDLLKNNTYQLEHKIGGEFSYQFDAKTRFKVGLDWIFAGRNVAQKLTIYTNLAVEF
ncbi:hypothetical protein GF322_00430 [Candidatus Dependentiae bacterium]|nr:hypothetical protein [Candidatus Dependentiae bacterium]